MDKGSESHLMKSILKFNGAINQQEINEYFVEPKNQSVFVEYIQDVAVDYNQTKKRNSELKFNYSALAEAIRLLSNL
jgi:predicted metal-dependent hydrolase